MNELALYFEALSEELAAESHSYSDLCFAVELYCHKFPKTQHGSISIIGLPDEVDDDDALYTVADGFRTRFYRLKRTARNLLTYDLGNLRPGPTEQDTRERLAAIVHKLVEAGSVPLLIGGARDWMIGHFQGLAEVGPPLHLGHIDGEMDMDTEEGIMHQVVTLVPDLPTHFVQLAYQSYLVDPLGLSVLDRLHYDSLRLGQIHGDFRRAEPHIRECDLLFFSLSALRKSAFTEAPGARSFGLNGEQACQLCWYAGISPRLKSLGLYNILPYAADNPTDMETLSIMVWHFLEGFSYRQDENPRDNNASDLYRVVLDGREEIIFYRSRNTDRWWVELPSIDKDDAPYLLPCLHEDYTQATAGYLPDRWIKALGRG